MRLKNWYSVIILFVSSCASNEANIINKASRDTANTNILSAQELSTGKKNDTLIVTIKSAVFYFPTNEQFVQRRKSIGNEKFQIGFDDYAYSMHLAETFLDSIKLPILEARDVKYIKFLHTDKYYSIIKLASLPELWGIYFFDPNKKEKLVDIINIEEEYISYFK